MVKRGDIITADLLNGIKASILRRIPSKTARHARQLPVLSIHQKPFQISPFKGGVTVGAGRVYYYTKLFKQDDYGYSSADFQIGFIDYPEQTFETNYELYSIVLEAIYAPEYFQVFQNVQDANGDFIEYAVKQLFRRAVPTGKLTLSYGNSASITSSSPSRIIASVQNYNEVIYHAGNVVHLLASPTDILTVNNAAEKPALNLTISTTIVPAQGGTITCRVVPKEESTTWSIDCEEARLWGGQLLPGSIFTGTQTFYVEIPQNNTGAIRTGIIIVWDNDNNQTSAEFTQL